MKTYRLQNTAGDELVILALGAAMQRWSTIHGGTRRDLILGYADAADYQQDSQYMGAVVGPYANRIGHGHLIIEQQAFQLEQNDGLHHLHGGRSGLQRQIWQLRQQQPNQLILHCSLPDGAGGYPGPSQFEVCYQLSEQQPQSGGTLTRLAVSFSAHSFQTSLIGPTLHPYFNLDPAHRFGVASNVIDQHQLQLNAQYFTVTDAQKIPTGELRHVQASPLDFYQAKLLQQTVLDDNFVVDGNITELAAQLISPDQAICLGVSTDYPGLQVYTGEHLSTAFGARGGICLEPQFFPDSPNQTCFPFHFTRPDQSFKARICYHLFKH